jgi:hypothetical protein
MRLFRQGRFRQQVAFVSLKVPIVEQDKIGEWAESVITAIGI